MRPGLPGYEPWYKPLLDWMNQLTLWEGIGLAFLLFTVLYLFYFMVRWRSYLGEPMELRYESGYPGVEGPLDGELDLTDHELRFRNLWKPSQIHFCIPLTQISGVSTSYGGLSTLAFWAIGASAVLGQHNFLEISLRDPQGRTQRLRFLAGRYSKAPPVWQKRLQEAVKGRYE